MERLKLYSLRRINEVETAFKRYLYDEINWDNRLIVIKGSKGVGKTTLILQHIRETFGTSDVALYASLDYIWFATHTIVDLAEYHYTHGGTHLFLDEVHKYKGWAQEIKNIYDLYPSLHVVLTGSSMLSIVKQMADLSRRVKEYTLAGMSFREYLRLEGVAELPVLTLNDVLNRHTTIALDITKDVKVLQYFDAYLHHGFYPFYREEGDGFEERLLRVIDAIIETEMPAVVDIEYESLYKVKQLLAILADLPPYTLNIADLCKNMSISRNTVFKLLELMHSAELIHRLFATDGLKQMAKPEKILFHNTNLMYALSPKAESGTLRETFVTSQLSLQYNLKMPEQGDLLVDDLYCFEVGGRSKGYAQIRGLDRSFVVQADVEVGVENKIPMWMMGMLY